MRLPEFVAIALTTVFAVPHSSSAQQVVDWAVHGSNALEPGAAVPYDISVSAYDGVVAIGRARTTQIAGDTLEADPYRLGYLMRSGTTGTKMWGHRGMKIAQYGHGDGLMMGYLTAVGPTRTYTAEGLPLSFDAGAREIGGQVIVAYDDTGDIDWVVAVADSTDSIAEINAYVKGLELDATGRIYYSALFYDTLFVHNEEFIADGVDALVASLNPDGTYRWVSAITGPGNQAPVGFVFDWAGGFDVSPTGRVVVAGLFPIGSVFGLGEPNETTLEESGVAIGLYDRDGKFLRADLDCLDLAVCGFAVATRIAIATDHSIRTVWRFLWSNDAYRVDVGDTTFTDPGYEGAFVTSHDSTGQLLWATQFRGDGNENLMSIAVDGQGNTYVGGAFDALEMTIGPNTSLRKSDLLLDEMDGFIVRLDTLGRVTWVMHMFGPDSQFINAIDVDEGGNVYFASHFKGTAHIGDDVYLSSGTDWLHGRISVSTINSTEEAPPPTERLDVYPNPARDYVVIRYPTVCQAPVGIETNLYDVLGRSVARVEARPFNGPVTVDTSALPSGIYVAVASCGAVQVSASFVVQ